MHTTARAFRVTRQKRGTQGRMVANCILNLSTINVPRSKHLLQRGFSWNEALIGQSHEIFNSFSDSTWAPYDQAKEVSENV